jgi:succinate dehydrogenase/fumarate reductase-like Fe-S protein
MRSEQEVKGLKEMVTLRVNGNTYELSIEPKKTLLEALRGEMGLTGTKENCGLGACGACTVLLDNKPVLSCLTLAIACRGKWGNASPSSEFLYKKGSDSVRDVYSRDDPFS